MDTRRLQRNLQRAVKRMAGIKVVQPQVTERQVARSEVLLTKLMRGTGAGTIIATPDWDVDYEANVLPDASTPVWTEVTTGAAVPHTVSNGRLTVTDTVDLDGIHWWIADSRWNNSDGVILEARLKITAGSSVVNRGSCLAVWDGAYQFVAWLRPTGMNIDNAADVPADLTGLHRIKLITRQTEVRLYLDGALKQIGTYMNATSKHQVGFGSYMAA